MSTAPSDEAEKNGSGPIVAYVAPFDAFLVLSQAEGLEGLKNYYPWVYTAKIALVSALCLYVCRAWPAWSGKGIGLGVLFGAVGIVLWVAISGLGLEHRLAEVIPAFKSILGSRAAYNPWESIPSQSAAAAFIAVRLLGLAVLVPIIEELFWRGFLLRYLIDERFERVPFGTFSAFSFAIVTLMFALVHPEILAAIVWGAGINLLAYQTKNLWACAIGHGVTNLLLGVYVLSTGNWLLW